MWAVPAFWLFASAITTPGQLPSVPALFSVVAPSELHIVVRFNFSDGANPVARAVTTSASGLYRTTDHLQFSSLASMGNGTAREKPAILPSGEITARSFASPSTAMVLMLIGHQGHRHYRTPAFPSTRERRVYRSSPSLATCGSWPEIHCHN